MASLSSLTVGDQARVVSLQACDKSYRQKLLSLGLTRGTEFKVIRKAPLGDPIQIEVRGFALSLRKGEAHGLEVERVES